MSNDTVTATTTEFSGMEQVEKENLVQLENLNKRFQDKPFVDEPDIVQLLNIPEDQTSNVRVFDEIPGLQLVHYLSSGNEKISHLRGVVVTTNETPPRVVCKSFPFTPEYLTTDFKMSDEEVSSATCTNGFEGTILRVFCYNEKWYLSTHKKINGRSSRWNSPTFGELFNDCLGQDKDAQTDFSMFNPNHCYVFLMSHVQNSLVCKHVENVLHHIVTYDTANSMAVVTDEKINHPSIRYPEQLKFSTRDEVVEYVDKMDSKIHSGLILFLKNGEVCKVINKDYHNKRQIRGNEPNLRIRYLQLEKIKGLSPQNLVDLLPEHKEIFDHIANDRQRLVQQLYNDFEFRYIRGNYLRLPREEFFFLEEIASMDLGTRGRLLSNEQKETVKWSISKKLELTSPRIINALIRNINSEF